MERLVTEDKRAFARELLRRGSSVSAPTVAKERARFNLERLPEAFYRFEEFADYSRLLSQGKKMSRLGVRNPYFNTHVGPSRDTIWIDEREYVNFSGFNYLGLSGDPRVNATVCLAVERYGTSVSASRLVSGDILLHRELEAELAKFHHVDAAVAFVSGYLTNVATIGYLFGPKDLLLHDCLIHNSALTGCVLSGARRIPFPHNNYDALEHLLAEHRLNHERVCVITEGVFSMDGDIPDLPRLITLRNRYKIFLMVDEAHSLGTLGARGGGLAEYWGVDPRSVDIWMGTLSKTLASCGGYIAGCEALIANLRYLAPGGVLYSVGMTPQNAAAALAALRRLKEVPERVRALQENSRLFLALAKAAGLNTGTSKDSPVIPVIISNSYHCMLLADTLFKAGINVQPMLYPVVPEEASRLRFFVTASHTDVQIRNTVERVAELLKDIRATTSAQEEV